MERTSNKSQHTKLTQEKKILPPFLPEFELAIFRSRVRRSNQQAIPASCKVGYDKVPDLKWSPSAGRASEQKGDVAVSQVLMLNPQFVKYDG